MRPSLRAWVQALGAMKDEENKQILMRGNSILTFPWCKVDRITWDLCVNSASQMNFLPRRFNRIVRILSEITAKHYDVLKITLTISEKYKMHFQIGRKKELRLVKYVCWRLVSRLSFKSPNDKGRTWENLIQQLPKVSNRISRTNKKETRSKHNNGNRIKIGQSLGNKHCLCLLPGPTK